MLMQFCFEFERLVISSEVYLELIQVKILHKSNKVMQHMMYLCS